MPRSATAQELCARLKSQGAASVSTVTLLDKSARRQVDVQPDYKGFEVRDSRSSGPKICNMSLAACWQCLLAAAANCL